MEEQVAPMEDVGAGDADFEDDDDIDWEEG